MIDFRNLDLSAAVCSLGCSLAFRIRYGKFMNRMLIRYAQQPQLIVLSDYSFGSYGDNLKWCSAKFGEWLKWAVLRARF